MTQMKKLVFTTMCLGAIVGTLGLIQAQAQSEPPKTIDADCWVNSFNDEFDTLDFWDSETNSGQWKTSYIWDRDTIINEELQYYIDPKEHGVSPFSVSDGILHIIADKTPASLQQQVKGQKYISGVLTTEKGFSQKYGRFEVFAKVPSGKGLWSAFWLLPSFDQWPEGIAILPEIDVMEYLGNEGNTYHTTLHTNQNGPLESHPYHHTLKIDPSEDFHLYSVIWTSEKVEWYFDEELVASHQTPKDYTEPVHFLLNLAVGGTWPGAPDANTRFPAKYSIDYVRAYTYKC